MSHPSRPDLRVLHAVRLLGFADERRIAERAGCAVEASRPLLRAAAERDLVRENAFADLRGWSLTAAGRTENERQLAHERACADPQHTIERVHRDFLRLNVRLVRACTDWQLKPTPEHPLGVNDHADPGWDGPVLRELTALDAALPPLVHRLSGVLTRFAGYDTRFTTALAHARDGDPAWVDATTVDSCHRVWFELHEDLVATLGIDRGVEGS